MVTQWFWTDLRNPISQAFFADDAVIDQFHNGALIGRALGLVLTWDDAHPASVWSCAMPYREIRAGGCLRRAYFHSRRRCVA
ncbi:MAG: hypothetical protein ACJAYU_004769 [Bradymonadia bacterium]|jgi:hypothetical protein